MNVPINQSQIIDNGLDRQNIATLKKRFIAVNEDRLERMRGALSDRHQIFMDVLPLLFHTNHPMMPGFVSRQTPARICHYKPSKRDILVGKMVAKSFTISYDPSAEDEIFGLYIMGSVGTIAQSEGSDLDIWVCHKPGLENKRINELQKKCDKISAWAMEMRLEVHFFLMDHEAFKAKKHSALDKESSGSAQHLLLLDEFYRSAIFVAGRIPIWWFVPSPEEHVFKEYTNTLLYKRFIPDENVLDFGGIAEIPASEFLGAGVWQLYKGIESPYKSVLKLLLLEAYVDTFPHIEPLAITFKYLLYSGETDINLLDSYVLIYQRIEQYLVEKGQVERLELVRRCFYYKVNKALSRPPSVRAKSWQRILLEDLTDQWGWSPEYIRFLDSRSSWKAADVITEHNKLVGELNHSYRFLLEFANSTSKKERAISPAELMMLGRKLQAAFERRPGKIDLINTSISNDISESVLLIKRVKQEDQSEAVWTAFSHEAGVQISDEGQAVKSANSPIELLLWCYLNGVIVKDTMVEIEEENVLSEVEVRRLLSYFREWLPLPLSQVKQSCFGRSATPEKALFLINAGKAPDPDLNQQGFQRLSDRSDALSYGGQEENLVASVDLVILNSWNEITIRRFENENALLDAISEYLQFTLPDTHQKPPALKVACVGNAHANIINSRVEKWISEITKCFFSGKDSKYKRFIFHMGDGYHCLQFRSLKPQISSFKSESLIIEHLSQEQSHYSSVVLDSQVLPGHPLKSITSLSRRGSINVFYRRFDIGVEMYIADERGSILHFVFRGRKKYNPLKPLYLFLRSVLNRLAQDNPELEGDFGVFPIQFIEILKDSRGHYTAQKRQVVADRPNHAFDVKASAHLGPDRELMYNFYCDGQEFSSQNFKDQLDMVVSQYILSRREGKEHYPVYISDLDLSQVADVVSATGELQIVHYLRIKKRLESKLNRAIGILLDA